MATSSRPCPAAPSALDTGSRLASAPPSPGTAASSVVNRPTRRTHQRVRAGTSIAAQAAVPGHLDGGQRVEHLVPQPPLDSRARPCRRHPGPQPERVGLAQPVQHRAGGPHERPQHPDDRPVRDRPVRRRQEAPPVLVSAAAAIAQPVLVTAQHSQAAQPPAARRDPHRRIRPSGTAICWLPTTARAEPLRGLYPAHRTAEQQASSPIEIDRPAASDVPRPDRPPKSSSSVGHVDGSRTSPPGPVRPSARGSAPTHSGAAPVDVSTSPARPATAAAAIDSQRAQRHRHAAEVARRE